MAGEKREQIRFIFMQDVLPVGLALADRVREGGFRRVFQVFNDSNTPLEELSKEGEIAAQQIRDQLDEVSPGLGNPVMEVTVDIEEPEQNLEDPEQKEVLLKLLKGINSKMNSLEKYFAEASETNTLDDNL